MSDASPSGHSLLAVFAHPDDESLASGGLLARCAGEGIRTSLLCLTRGGLGAIDDQDRLRMGESRARELEGAARELGVSDLSLLDYRNGFLPWADRDQIEADIRNAIARSGAEVIVTFDEDGLYWHPDHIVLHERTTAVVAGMGPAAPALFYVSMPKGSMRAAWAAASVGHPVAGGESALILGVEVDAFGLFTLPPTFTLDVSAFAACKLRALRCHRSQLEGDALDRLPDEAVARVLGTELYRRSTVGSAAETFLDRMARVRT
jgi:LmbE family N-acetylglucosaminyl deacetylase